MSATAPPGGYYLYDQLHAGMHGGFDPDPFEASSILLTH